MRTVRVDGTSAKPNSTSRVTTAASGPGQRAIGAGKVAHPTSFHGPSQRDAVSHRCSKLATNSRTLPPIVMVELSCRNSVRRVGLVRSALECRSIVGGNGV